jgi:ankyrin repeat protein
MRSLLLAGLMLVIFAAVSQAAEGQYEGADFSAVRLLIQQDKLTELRQWLDEGGDANARGYMQRTPLMEAADQGKVEFAKLLLEHGADISARDENGFYALHWAVLGPMADKHNAAPMVKLLLDYGANVNAGLGEVDTPLHRSVFYCTPEVWQLLLDRGAQINAENVYNLTPLHFACSGNYSEARDWLVAHGARVDDLYLAGSTDNLHSMVDLLSAGADINMHDWRGMTVLDWAARNGAWKSVALLTVLGAKTGEELKAGTRPNQ